MIENQIIELIVCINEGSGVLFQPSCEDSTYILTCDHVVNNPDPGQEVPVARIYLYKKGQKELIKQEELKLIENKNFFRDTERDLAIIKISKVKDIPDLLYVDEFEKFDGQISLAGYPAIRRRANTEILSSDLRLDRNISLNIENFQGKREAAIPGNPLYNDIVGQSGGGLFCINDGYLSLLGIQCSVPSKEENLGRIIFTPIKDFAHIIISSEGHLESIEPYYIKHFKFLTEEIFKISPVRNSDHAIKLMTKVLGDQVFTITENLTPQIILNSVDKNLLLLHGQQPDHLLKKKLWILWLEVLAIAQLTKPIDYRKESFDQLFQKIRFFYSNTNEIFFHKHLRDLYETNYENLEPNGTVIVASNNQSLSDLVFDPTEIVPDISDIRKDFEYQKQIRIDAPKEFILDKYRFINISVFKEEILQKHFKTFNNMNVIQVFEELKKIYGEYIN
ncbi:ABC-three component system protein [[Flexibacter] sp. ATCC 35208]|uniref:ABC-three component system protein n=1 Tax=[Flexibacter] sp. ATCC 35208 TaxID=1936242 RepID=UPI0009CA4E1F|nr:ABC-three component system protein [[Flexibacter] sp. ATCC 35208]OMP74734.1 hypothetical protein BW716_33805 [[Flexibacter] sp. ATCC 35208]